MKVAPGWRNKRMSSAPQKPLCLVLFLLPAEIIYNFDCWECKLVCPRWTTVQRFLKKLKIELSAIPLLGIFLKEMKILIPKGICTPMYTQYYLQWPRYDNNLNGLSMDEMKKMWHTHTLNGILFSHKKE